ncbi:MAG: GEVED domain-containing protein [Candidatus Kapaibacterium sp.]
MKKFFRFLGVFVATALTLFGSNSSMRAQTVDPAPYCGALNNWYGQTCTTYWMGIGQVKITNGAATLLDKTSDCNGTQFYTYYNNVTPPTLIPGQTYNWEVRPYPGMTVNYTNQLSIWIDWDGNTVFNDAGAERIGGGQVGQLAPGSILTGTFTVPTSGFSPILRMRLRTMNSGTMTACGDVNYGETEDYPLMIGGGGIKDSYPTLNSVLLANRIYDGSPGFAKPSLLVNRTVAPLGQRITRFRFVVVSAGSLVPGTVVYEALDPITYSTTITNFNNATDPFTITASKAQGTATNGLPPSNPGNDGSFITTGIPAGTYRIEAIHELLSGTTVVSTTTYSNEFIIALNRDMSCVSIESPLSSNRQRYLRTYGIPIRAIFKNVGLESVTRYRAIAEVRRAIDGSLVRRDTVERSSASGSLPAAGLQSTVTDEVIINSNFVSNQADSFSLKVWCELLETVGNQFAYDEQISNDVQPRAGQTYVFQVWYLIDFETKQILNPPATGAYAGRTLNVSALFANNGLASDPVPATLTIKYNNQIISQTTITQEVPNGFYNTTIGFFPPFTPQNAGTYEFCIKILAPGDEYSPNDEKCMNVTVLDRLNGIYTIGSNSKPGVPGFPTIQTAVDALYRQGVRGAVTFQLTDPFYSVGSTSSSPCGPALELTSRIVGMDANNTVTFVADPQSTGLSKAGVVIQLNSCNGAGIELGQKYNVSNPNAIQFEFQSPDNANSRGYITFDGGPQKSLKFQLRSYANRRAVFYIGKRAYNNTVKNCIIELDPSTPELDFWSTLPGVTIESNAFKFGADSAGFGGNFSTFTAGIFQRNMPPSNEFGNNIEKLDTVIVENNVTYYGNKANKFIGNEIRGFGYGIASIGIGTLKKNNKLTRYYNSGTEIRDNMISKVRRAGIFLGYEDGAMVTGNKIFDVGLAATGKTGEANGIEVGGQQNNLSNLGFNNINCEIGRNEINGVTSDVFARGIKVQQSLNDLSSVVPPPGEYLQPSVAENMNIHGNMIWGLSRTNAGASRAGIHLFTDRNGAAGINGLITARIANYFTRNDQIANNTIMMANDNISNSGGVVGIGVQHAKSTTLMNNAIAMTGTNTTADIAGGYPHAALFYQGLHPKYVGGMTADRNAYWSPNAATVRFYEIDSISQTLLAGYQDEYQTLAQWRAWTKQDLNSLIGNWTGDYVTTGVAPIQYVRIRTNPAPTGSILNNRGARIANVTSDVDGQARGSAGQAYDIGADEFNGVSYVNDVEVTTILAPRSYRTGASQVNFADAEHLMIDANVKVVARLRNNGSISQVVNVVGEYAVENSASSGNSLPSYPSFSGLSNVTVQIAAGESKDVDLGVLSPQSLSQLSGYTTPIWMQKQVDSSMRVNVTPRYKIQARITTPDENFGNNSDAMDARFYIRRSNIKMMTSWVGKSYAHTNAANVSGDPLYARNTIARLNADSLKRGLDAIGFWSGLKTGIAMSDINYDIMDRDGWEPRSVDYTWYKTLVWSEDNTGMTRFERDNIRDFVAASNVVNTKKNFVIGSQEIVKTHVGLNAVNDEYFPRYTLRSQRGKSTAAIPAVVTTPVAAGYAMPPIVAPFRSDVVGMTIEKNITENIKGTGFVNGTFSDPLPLPALMSAYVDGFTQGLARPAFKYTTKDANVADSAMGITVTGAGTNIVHLGVDWRHYGKTTQSNGIERVLRGTLDFFDVNDGTVVPVELADFDAKAAGKSVNVFWSTASESNSGWFEVERKQAGSEFANVATVPAAGTSTSILNYGIKDENVESGATYTYRLKNVDRDGKTGYSYEVEVVIGGESTTLSLGNATPSPINNESTVNYSMTIGGDVALNLYDMMGRLVQSVDNGNRAAGAHVATINSNGLSSGMYQLVLKVGSETTTRLVQIVK